MDRAFRQLPANFGSVLLLGFHWRSHYYFDLVMMMGCRIAPYICQRTTNMVAYIHRSMGYFILNYVDDFVAAEYYDQIVSSHEVFIHLLKNIGIMHSE